ncbi:gamma-glutamylcyclotransferase 2-3-like, partial [Salvia splendens]|uniref:gamma-glutamylcyclotransferase 2-3-like n=1 Tax=Salvia splendens TaxID=180675 RepID=UPI001C27BD87
FAGSTDHRGTPEFPGRTVTLEAAEGEVCWGAAYKITNKEDQITALEHLEVREKQYDKKVYVDFFTDASSSTPLWSLMLWYKKLNQNYLGPASLEEIAIQIVRAKGPSGPNTEYLFKLENALVQIGFEDKHVRDLADEVRQILSLQGELVD